MTSTGRKEMIYVRQDGADFYVYSDPEGETLTRTETSPIPVSDGDFHAAIKARAWFEEYGYFKGAEQLRWL
jgi:hypothetical protein